MSSGMPSVATRSSPKHVRLIRTRYSMGGTMRCANQAVIGAEALSLA